MEIHYGKTDASIEESGYDQLALDRLNAHFKKLIEDGKIQAACYLLSRNGKIFVNASMGKLTLDKKSADFLPDSIRAVASVTKVFTATAILQLIETGKIFLNQCVSTILKEFDTDIHKQITIFHLLTHTSGLAADPGAHFEPYPAEFLKESWTKDNWIKNILSGPLQYKTGTTWNYSSKGFAFLAEIVSKVSGMEYTDYVTENILKPLEMNDSFYFVPDDQKHRVCIVSDWNREMLSFKKNKVISTSLMGGGGLFSTVADMWKLGQMMLNGGTFNGKRILGRKTTEAAIKLQIKEFPSHNWLPNMFDECKKNYGLGWQLKQHPFLPDDTFNHEGAEGAGLFVDPGEKFIFSGFYPSENYLGESWVSPLAIAWSGIN